MGILAMAAIIPVKSLVAQKPVSPANLQVDTIIGHQVHLSWSNPDTGAILHQMGFETLSADTISFTDGWTIKTTNSSDYACTWFNFPSPEIMREGGDYSMMIHSGKRSATVFPDMNESGDHDMHQDEWLISPIIPNAAYLQFSHLTTPEIVENGADPEYPDHYVVMVSTDGGETWGEPLWDARYNADMSEDWQTTTLALAAVPTENMRIAFRAYGEYQLDENNDTINQSLYGAWAIDDIVIRAMGSDEPGHSTISRYRITIDDEDLDEVYGTTYIDNSAKTPGEHTYSVYSVSANGAESEPVSVKVNLPELHFDAPRNFTCKPSFDEATGRYSVTMTWDAPESDFQPVSYTIYNGQLLFGQDLTAEDGQNGVGITGCFGIYQFSIVAIYQAPDGESEPIVRNLALGVRFGVNDLKAETSGNNVDLSWTTPFESEYEMDSYTVYRGQEKIAEGLKTTSYQDKDVKDGYYQYSVIVVYKDGVESIRSSVPLQVGETVLVPMPYSQPFNTTFCPENWKVVNQSQRTPDKYIWYFDDRSRLGVKGEGFEGCYAAIDCLDAPGYSRDATLELPVIDLSSAQDRSSITLSFYYSLGIASGSICKVGTEWSLDGEDWNVLEIIDPSTGFTPSEDGDFHIRQAVHTIGDYPEILNAINNAEALYLRIHYTANRSKFFALDNVLVTSDGRVANQTAETENVTINVSAYNGLISIDALQASIQNVEVFSMQGMRLLERKGKGEAFMTLPAPQRGPAIVRVTTSKGVKVAKLFL